MTENNPVPTSDPITYSSPMSVPGSYAGPAPSPEEKNMAMLTYLLAIFTSFLGPLIIWMMKKDVSPFIDDQGKEVLNFEITSLLASVIAGALCFILIGFLLIPIIMICRIVFLIIGLLKAKDGIAYRFPFALRLLK